MERTNNCVVLESGQGTVGTGVYQQDLSQCVVVNSLPRRTSLERKLIAGLVVTTGLALLSFAVIVFRIQTFEEFEKLQNVCITEECVKTAASLLSAMDQAADPCEDFFQFACGTWNRKHIIPEDRSSISTFEVLADQLQLLLKDLLEESFNNMDSSSTKKAKRFYKSCMNTSQILATSDSALKRVLHNLGGWPVVNVNWRPQLSLEALLGKMRLQFNIGILLEQWVGPDDKNSTNNIIQLDQMQLGLPSRDYFLKESSQKERESYLNYMADIATLLGSEQNRAYDQMALVVAFETQLANASIPEPDRHDTSSIYVKLSLGELQQQVPEFNWRQYLEAFLPTPIPDHELIVGYALPYLKQMGKLIRNTDPVVVYNYAVWRVVMFLVEHLPGPYEEQRVQFRRILQGVQAERPRWAQCVEWANKQMGMAVGALFIRRHFDPQSKATALAMIATIREAFHEILDENEWMDEDTKIVAKEKADAMKERIGYPDLLTDVNQLDEEYKMLNISEDDFVTNVLYVLRYKASHNLEKLREPVDKNKWSTEPAVVNAFYGPNKNDIVFPAGILQPLFYSQYSPKSLNYGGIGVVIGHEITHGFDDKGRQFDKDGNLKQWWNDATIEAFRERTQCIIDQYSQYKLNDVGLYVNGRMTQGENIADNGGLKESYRAYRKWTSTHGADPLLPGLQLNHDQLFFLNYAQIWCGSMRPEDALTKIRSSVHSPGPVRVMGPLSNSKDFAEAYNCPIGSQMNPVEKCAVW